MPEKPVQHGGSPAKPGEDGDLTRKLDAVQARTRIAVDTTEVAAVVEAIVESLSGDMSIADLKLYRELEQLAQYIQRAKREIAEVKPNDIRERHIPMATDELDAVVEATAEATGAILDEAEAVQELAATLPPPIANKIAAAVTRIYEACNFQDITGQRITKVVKTLKYIERKIDALLAAFGDTVAGKQAQLMKSPDEDFVSGPQLPKAANSQDEIDAILASLDGK
ncbi:MAG TPA: protein phosphatase CheZ [Stellaceae bacterium]